MLQVLVHCPDRKPRHVRRCEVSMVVDPRSIAQKIGVPSRGRDADGLGGPSEQVADLVGKFLELIGGMRHVLEGLIVQHRVVSWSSGA